MFTGMIEAVGHVDAVSATDGGGRRLRVRIPRAAGWRLAEGESVAVSGVCLTVVESRPARLGFDLGEETQRVTTLGDVVPGEAVNLERPLRLDTRLGGHLVLGHVDGVGRVAAARREGEGRRLTVEVPRDLRPLLIPKGSVTVDGVSLTIADLGESTFDVALVPHTLGVTTLGARGVGARVNLETDVIGKYVRALLRQGVEPQGLSAFVSGAGGGGG